MILLNNGSKHCIFFISYSKLVLIRSVQQGRVCKQSWYVHFSLQTIEDYLFNHPWWFKCVSGSLGSSFVFGTGASAPSASPAFGANQTPTFGQSQRCQPANPQVLDLYHLQGHYFLLVLSLHHLLLGQCQAVDSLLCLGSSLVSLHLALEQL